MKFLSITASLTLALGLISAGTGFADDTATNDVSSEIVTAITITSADPLEFGQIAAGVGAGTVTINATTGLRSGSGVTLLVAGTTPTPATFDVTGDSGSTYAINLPSADVTITSTALDTMIVNAFSSNPSGTSTLVGGVDSIAVGATLNVGAAQPAGVYVGTFDVTVDYN